MLCVCGCSSANPDNDCAESCAPHHAQCLDQPTHEMRLKHTYYQQAQACHVCSGLQGVWWSASCHHLCIQSRADSPGDQRNGCKAQHSTITYHSHQVEVPEPDVRNGDVL